MLEIKNNEMFQSLSSKEEPESVVFVQEVFLYKKIQEKEDVFVDLITNFLKSEDGGCSVKKYRVL